MAVRYWKSTDREIPAYYQNEMEDMGDNIIEIELDEFRAGMKDFWERMKIAKEGDLPAISEMDFEGLTINCYDDDDEGNLDITGHYISQYKEDLELVELGELLVTSITEEQYIALLKQRKQWRS